MFYGKGKLLSEVTPEEMAQELEERKSENPRAFQNDIMPYQLNESEVEKIKRS